MGNAMGQKLNTLTHVQSVRLVDYIRQQELTVIRDQELADRAADALGFAVSANNITRIRREAEEWGCKPWRAHGSPLGNKVDDDITDLRREVEALKARVHILERAVWPGERA